MYRRRFFTGMGYSGSSYYPPGYDPSIVQDIDLTGSILPSQVIFTRTSTATDAFYTDPATRVTYKTYASNIPRFIGGGLWIESARTNLFLNSDAPVTQTITLGVGLYFLWVTGTGSAVLSAGTAVYTGGGTATNGTPVFFNVTTAGTVTVTITGSLLRVQVETSGIGCTVPSSYIPTGATSSTRAAETATLTLPAAWFSGAAFTVVIESETWPTFWATPSNTTTSLRLDDGSSNNNLVNFFHTGSVATTINSQLMSGGVNQAVADSWNVGLATRYRAGISLGAGIITTSTNGATTYSKAVTQPNQYSFTRIGFGLGGGASVPQHGRKYALKIWNRALVGAELQAATEVPALTLNFMKLGVIPAPATFSRASTGTYFDDSGVLRTAASGAPRWDYNPVTNSLNGLLMEESRTNLRTNSGDFSTWIPTNSSIIPGSGIAPDTVGTFTKLVDTIANTVHYLQGAAAAVTVTANTPATFSVFAKAGEIRYLQLVYDDNTNGVYATFDLQNGVISQGITVRGTGTAISANYQAIGNGVYRCSITGIPGPTTTTPRIPIVLQKSPTGYAIGYTGDGVSGLYIWGVQVEQGGFITSYIPTAGATVTRAQDICTITSGNMGWFTSPGGSWYGEYVKNTISNVGSPRVIGRLAAVATTTPMYGHTTGGVAQFDGAPQITSNVVSAGVLAKCVSTWTAGTARIGVNNGPIAVSTNLVTGYAVLATSGIYIMQNASGLGESMTGYIRQIKYWPRILTDAEIQYLTS